MFGCLSRDIFETFATKLSSSCSDNAELSIFLMTIIYETIKFTNKKKKNYVIDIKKEAQERSETPE